MAALWSMRLFLLAARRARQFAWRMLSLEFRTFLSTSTVRVLVFTGGLSTSGVDLVRKVLNDMGATYLLLSRWMCVGASGIGSAFAGSGDGPEFWS